MGRRSQTGGVTPKGDRIQLTFTVGTTRYRPTIDLKPTAANLKHAHRRIEDIKRRIANGTFNFAEEFPEYRFINKVQTTSERATFGPVCKQFLSSIKSEVEFATYDSYRRILENFWMPKLDKPIADIRYSDLTTIIGDQPWTSRKTRNNVVSVVRRVFQFAVDDNIIKSSPAERIKSLKVQKEPPDPFALDEAETIIQGLRDDWGDDLANYFEFNFFVGLRPSEQIAMLWPDCDMRKGIAKISKARVMGRDKARTKTFVSREVELCPRALGVLRRQKALTFLAGEQVFGPYHDTQVQLKRWTFTLKRLGIRHREAYQTRHTSVTWHLMIGENLLQVAQNHGHSPAVMLKVYAKWLSGSTPQDVENIRLAMGYPSGKSGGKSRDIRGL